MLARLTETIANTIYFIRTSTTPVYDIQSGVFQHVFISNRRALRMWFDAATCAIDNNFVIYDFKYGLSWQDEINMELKDVEWFSLNH